MGIENHCRVSCDTFVQHSGNLVKQSVSISFQFTGPVFGTPKASRVHQAEMLVGGGRGDAEVDRELGARARFVDESQKGGLGRSEECGDGARVDDHDVLTTEAVVDQRLDRAAALGAIADDHHVIGHPAPPPGNPELFAALGGEHLQGGPDQQHEEADAGGGDDEGVDQPGPLAHRGDDA